MCSLCALLRSVALNLRSICAHFALLTSALLYPFAPSHFTSHWLLSIVVRLHLESGPSRFCRDIVHILASNSHVSCNMRVKQRDMQFMYGYYKGLGINSKHTSIMVIFYWTRVSYFLIHRNSPDECL